MSREKLEQFILDTCDKKVLLAFSGGIDSTVLLKVLSNLSEKIKTIAVTFKTELHPQNELEECILLTKLYEVEHKIVEINEFDNEEILKNPVDRCYLCKKDLFSKLEQIRKELGFDTVMDGTNLDDTKVYRPGLKALGEMGVISPLKELGLSKEEVRKLAKNLGIRIFDKPSAPCLATRLPYGDRIDKKMLSRIDEGENYLKSLGYEVVRLRLHKDIVRIEVGREDFSSFCERSLEIVEHLKELGFRYITLDLEGFRSGSMDEVLNV